MTRTMRVFLPMVTIAVLFVPARCALAAARPERTISVNVPGSVRALPDVAVIRGTLTATGTSTAEAVVSCKQKARAFEKVLKELKIGSDEYIESGIDFGSAPIRKSPDEKTVAVHNSFTVYLMDLYFTDDGDEDVSRKTAELLAKLVSAGLEVDVERGGVLFELHDSAESRQQAAKNALEKAVPMARGIAASLGARIGAVDSVEVRPTSMFDTFLARYPGFSPDMPRSSSVRDLTVSVDCTVSYYIFE